MNDKSVIFDADLRFHAKDIAADSRLLRFNFHPLERHTNSTHDTHGMLYHGSLALLMDAHVSPLITTSAYYDRFNIWCEQSDEMWQ